MPITQAAKKTKYLITDSADIALAVAAVATQSNVGAAFDVFIPANGIIRMACFSGQILNNAVAAGHNTLFGIRIGSTNYWFNVGNATPLISDSTVFNSGNVASAAANYNGIISYAGVNSQVTAPLLDIAACGIPSGLQTVQLIAGYLTNQTTLKGTVKQTRVNLEVIE